MHTNERTIFMVDDNEIDILHAEREIKKSGMPFRFESEQDADRLIERLDELHSNGISAQKTIVLLDIWMHGVDGYDALDTLRAHPNYCSLPVLMFSGTRDKEQILKCFTHASDGFLSKPFNTELFMQALMNVPHLRKKLDFHH